MARAFELILERSLKTLNQPRVLRLVLAVGLASAFSLSSMLAGCSSYESTEREAQTNQESNIAVEKVRTISREDALADFDAMWSIVNETHFDPEFNGVDWQAVRDEYRPQAASATNRNELRHVMRDALETMGQSHFGIIPEADPEPEPQGDMETAQADTEPTGSDMAGSSASSHVIESHDGYDEVEVAQSDEPADASDDSATDGIGEADTGIAVRIIDGQAVVFSVRDQSPAQLAGVETGWILSKARQQSIKGKLDELAQYVDKDEIQIHGVSIIEHTLQGPEDSTIDLTFVKGDGSEVELNIAREPMPGEFVKFGNLPPLSTHLLWEQNEITGPSGAQTKIGYIKFNIWMIPIAPKFERAMYELRDSDGIIIDLRGNPGGVGALSSALGRFLVSEPGSLGTMQMRGTELKFNIEPVVVTTWGERLKPFDGPIAILTDAGTASTSEVFAGGLQSLGRVQVFGTRSAGMALPAGMDKLPSGDVLLHAIANFVTSTGEQLEHGGVVPDHEVDLTREDLLMGVDSPRAAAEKWIEEESAE